MSVCAEPARHRGEAADCFPRLSLTKVIKHHLIQNLAMKYMLLVHVPKETYEAPKNPAEVAAGRAYGEALMAAGIFVAGAGLEGPQNTTTVSVRDGKRQVQDGPYAETKELLAGFVVIDVPDLDTALEWAARNPAAAHRPIEVRPLAGSYFATGSAASK